MANKYWQNKIRLNEGIGHSFLKYLLPDPQDLRNYLKSKYKGIHKIYIERQSDNRELSLIIYTSRPGVIIGKKGAESSNLTNRLEES